MTHKNLKLFKIVIQSFKIAIGSAAAILIASELQLEFAPSAGIITLLSVVSTKWDTLKLSLARILSFLAVIPVTFATLPLLGNEWVAYGILIFVTVLFSSLFGIESTVSTNAVIGTHFLMTGNYSFAFICNEFLLVAIGISIAVIVNLIHGNESQKKKLQQDIYYVEEKMRLILHELSGYLRSNEGNDNKSDNSDKEKDVWEEISSLEEHLTFSIEFAHEYQGNTFASHPGYYIQYMEMRNRQCNILHNLHREINRIRTLPAQAEVIAGYMAYLRNYVVEYNVPDMQEQELNRIFSRMKQEPLPVTRDEFENRAILYYVLMNLEDFLSYKRHFIESLSEVQRRIYWRGEW